MSQIAVNHLTFAYDGSYDNIFDDVSFRLDTDWRLGLTGRNGRGKTTLLRLLMGQLDGGGSIAAPGVRFAYFPYPVTGTERTAAEVVLDAVPELELWQLLKEMAGLGLEEDVLERVYATLSSGEQTKLLLAALFSSEERFLLIDEPTNHLDQAGRALTGDYLRKKRGFILVSHDRAFLDRCIDHLLVMERSRVLVRQGSFSSWWQDKQQQDALERRQNEKLQQEIRRDQAAARRAESWSGQVEKELTSGKNAASGLHIDKGFVSHKAAKAMKRAKNIQHRAEAAQAEKEELFKNVESSQPLKLHPLEYHSNRLLELREVSPVYDGRAVCRPVSFQLCRGERVALRGSNGCGKSSLLNLICGAPLDHTGTVQVGSGLVISRVRQETAHLHGTLDELVQAQGVDGTLFKTILRKLDLTRLMLEKPMEQYSEGQKKKVLLALSLSQSAHLYVWDEPLNFIDVFSRIQIEELLKTYVPTLLFVEHDAAF